MAYTDIDKSDDYFNTVLWTGNNTGTTREITGVGFTPNLIWSKRRSGADASHQLYDTIRGTQKILITENTSAEITSNGYGAITTFGSDGYTWTNGSDGTNPRWFFNESDTYCSWNWKAGTSFTNDASATGIGSIDSSGSANDTSGFSIISWSGTGSTGTLKHGLSTTPSMIITKSRGSSAWCVYNKHLGNTNVLFLDTAAATSAHIAYWNNTSPTSSVFTVGSDDAVNHSGNNMIAYCFAEKKGYSKFGSYTGNGNADGTFSYLGFRPTFVMTKKTNSGGNWYIWDNKRDTYNLSVNILQPQSSVAEVTLSSSDGIDFLSNGFKLRSTDTDRNGSGNTYIYMAFAENPFVTSTGVPACAR